MSLLNTQATEITGDVTRDSNSHLVSFQSHRLINALPKVACSTCHLQGICLPASMGFEEVNKLNDVVTVRKRVKRGTALYRRGDEFSAIYIVRTGFFKTVVDAGNGHDQVTGFRMAAEAMGMDGINNDRHSCHAIALEDSDVCLVPFGQLQNLAHDLPSFQHQLHRMMSREIVREHRTLLLLGSMRADARVAAFLMDLVHRLHSRGYSSQELVLRMTREEIGSFLGLKLETVSRTFSKFVGDGLIEVQQRQVRILEPDGLTSIFANHP